MNNFHSYLAGIFSLCVLLSLSGCGGSNVKAGGSVAFPDGTVLSHGTVIFTGGQHQYTGEIQTDGSFQLGGLKAGDGLPPGTYNVAVFATEGEGESILDEKFSSSEHSGITFEVVKGKSEPFKITVERAGTAR